MSLLLQGRYLIPNQTWKSQWDQERRKMCTCSYHALMMATLSSYIDRILSSSMKEGHTKQITFPEIEPSKWEVMMRYLEPGKRETVPPDVDEAKELAKWYDKYDFQSGLSMCDLVVHDFTTSENKKIPGANIDAYVVVCNHNLVFSQRVRTDFFEELLWDPAGRRCLTFTDISTLAPLIGQVDSLWAAAAKSIHPAIEYQASQQEGSFLSPRDLLLPDATASGYSERRLRSNCQE